MTKSLRCILSITISFISAQLFSQIVINEGSNKNYSTIADEDNEYKDWIELHNAGDIPVDLYNYSLSDNSDSPGQYVLPHLTMQPGEFQVIFCSSKNRYPSPAATHVATSEIFVPTTGWNTHVFSTPFIWDGVSNIVINTCSYSSAGYISNSVFNQTIMPFPVSTSAWVDGSPAACGAAFGEASNLRPNMRLNGSMIGTGIDQNCNTCYPAPYGNWYWGARTQMLLRADELLTAGLTAGTIDSLAFDVASTDFVTYDYIEVKMHTTPLEEMSAAFINTEGSNLHTNFSLSSMGESVFLFGPDNALVSSLSMSADTYDVSNGLYPDGDALLVLFQPPTPGSTNNLTEPSSAYAEMPVFSENSGFYNAPLSVTITNPNGAGSEVYYTLDASDPTQASILYTGEPIAITESAVLRARAFSPNFIGSQTRVATYFYDVDHVTPILSVTTDNANLYGPNGNFDNPMNDWLKSAYVEYFDSIPTHPLLFSQQSGLIQDGGWGGSRTQPQRSFRLKLADGVLGGDPMEYQVIPNSPNREVYSDFYLRNGSNQFLTLPYKDACQVQMMAGETHNYYSAWRPVSVYINGEYWGLYELRDKFNKEKFHIEDNATDSTIEILSLSAFYGFVLRAVEGDVNNFLDDYNAYTQIDPAQDTYWEQADQYFDLKYYTDYIIAETWMGNVDWPGNNIKIYRSDATDYRWRFCVIDLELSLLPNSWTDCNTDHIAYMLGNGTGNPYLSIWNIGLTNPQYRSYFINRFADVMNTGYESSHLVNIENAFYNQVVEEMPKEYERWGDPNNIPEQMTNFHNNHMVFQSELECRSAQVRNHLQNNLGLVSQKSITLAASPAEAGYIQINTIIPGSLPWTGIYFQGVPVTITAVANPGFVFSHWLSDTLFQVPLYVNGLTLNLSLDDTLTAHFIGLAEPTELTISEINYHSDVTQYSADWFELHNYGNGAVNLTGWSVTNGNNQPRFDFPAGTILYPNQYLVVVKDSAAFHAQYPTVNNYIGHFHFSLSGGGGSIKIYNQNQSVFLTAPYATTSPWPVIADGGGRTLELLSPEGELSDPLNWFAGCMFGSPGEAFHPCPETIVFSEINYQSSTTADAGDWVEIRNISSTSKDISGWIFRDNESNNIFQIPEQTILGGGEMVVLSSDVNLFDQQFPEITNRLGGYDFVLNDTGEMIRLYDDQDKLYFSMNYSSELPWPQQPAGDGYTLELLDSTGNFNSYENWFEGCLHGSPGTYFTTCGLIESVETISTNSDMYIFPNPTRDIVQILVSGGISAKANIQVLDALGRVVEMAQTEKHQNGFYVEMNNLSAGWYVVRIVDEDKVMLGKVMRE